MRIGLGLKPQSGIFGVIFCRTLLDYEDFWIIRAR